MLIGIDRNEVKEFISAADQDSEIKTVFLIGNVSNVYKMTMIGHLIVTDEKDSSKVRVNQGELQKEALSIVKAGLRGVKNLFDKKTGKPADTSEITDALIDSIPFQVLYELAGAIIKYNFEMGEVRKN